MMGYDGMVIRWEGRDADMQAAWITQQAYQFRWQPSAVLSTNRSEMFTHIINGNYGDLTPQNSYVMGFGCDASEAARAGKAPDGKACSWVCPVPMAGLHCTIPAVTPANVRCSLSDRISHSRSGVGSHAFTPLEALPCV
jgi:hypothetical protein